LRFWMFPSNCADAGAGFHDLRLVQCDGRAGVLHRNLGEKTRPGELVDPRDLAGELHARFPSMVTTARCPRRPAAWFPGRKTSAFIELRLGISPIGEPGQTGVTDSCDVVLARQSRHQITHARSQRHLGDGKTHCAGRDRGRERSRLALRGNERRVARKWVSSTVP